MNNNKINEFLKKYGKIIMLCEGEEGLIISIVDTMVDYNEDILAPNDMDITKSLETIINDYPISEIVYPIN